MEQVCPLCNGMLEHEEACPICGYKLEDGGALQNYFGPYSPYMDYRVYQKESLGESVSIDQCMHLFYCPACHYDKRIGINKITL